MDQKMSTAAMNATTTELQGIGSVLRSSEHQRSKSAASLRRTLSADMSSKKWQAKNGFCPLKRIASSEEFQVVPEEGGSMFEIGNNGKKEDEPPGQSDIWSTIVSQKASLVPNTYVHPLTKKNRSLSQQSLEICTESLGSETGSDGFSTLKPSVVLSSADEEEEKVEKAIQTPTPTPTLVVIKQEVEVVKSSSHGVKKSPPRSFPPPLASLSHSGLHVRSHRVEGRLVLEAVPVPALTQTYFQAQREGGRLLLTYANPKPNEATNPDNTKLGGKTKTRKYEDEEDQVMFQEDEEEIEVPVEFEEEEEEEGNEEEEEAYDTDEENQQVMDSNIVVEMKVTPPTRVINVHRSALMVNKIMGLTNIDPTWSSKLQKMVDAGDDQAPLVQSLPMVSRLIPSPTAASSLNKYDYSWRTNAVAAPTVCTHPLTQNPPPINKNNKFLLPKNLNPQEQQELVLMKGSKVDYLVPIFKGCKEPRRSLFWEPYCIAT